MRFMIVTDPGDGRTRRLNPMQIIGWKAAEIRLPPREGDQTVRTMLGTEILLPGGVAHVAESVAIIDSMFVLATSDRTTGQPVRAPAAPEED